MKLLTQIALIFLIAVLLPLACMRLVMAGAATYTACLLAILAAAVLLFFWIFESVVRPLEELKKGTRKIKEGSLDFTLETDSETEIGELVRSFEEMRLRLRESQNERVNTENETRELVSNIAHDLKTPITTIRGYSEGLLDGVADSPEKQKKYIMAIHNKAVEMTRLIDELSYYSKIDSNRIPYNFKKMPARGFFDDCAEELRLDLDGKGICFVYSQELSPEIRVIADPEQLHKVISNIVSNSVKYMSRKPGEIRMELKDAGDFVQCDLSDNGRGVDKKDLPRIYDRFFRTDASRGSLEGGSGIGLSIVKKIIEDHGGRIWATSEPGEGLTQHFLLRKI